MGFRKGIIDGTEYNLLTDEELEELKFVIALEERRKEDKKDVDKNYMSIEKFEKLGEEFYGV